MTSAERLSDLAQLARPVSLAFEQALPVLGALEPILPHGTLQRGSTFLVEGGAGLHSLALALAAEPSRAGSWVAAVGIPSLGVASATELGVVLERLVLITPPPASLWPTVAAALIDSFDVVLLGWPEVSGSMARRLGMRTRDRKSVLIPVAAGRGGRNWHEAADVRLAVTNASWEGLGSGHGRLAARRLEVETAGRRSPRPRRTVLWLPDDQGRVTAEPRIAGGSYDGLRPAADPIPFPAASIDSG